MTKKELIEAIEDYPDTCEITILKSYLQMINILLIPKNIIFPSPEMLIENIMKLPYA